MGRNTRSGARARRVLVPVVAMGSVAGGTLAVTGPALAGPPAPSTGSYVGYACGYYTYTGMWSAPSQLQGCGQAKSQPVGAQSPEVRLPTGGSSSTISASRSGAISSTGPAVWFSGPWPVDPNAAAVPSGQLTASTTGTAVVEAQAQANSVGPGPFVTGPPGSTTGSVFARCTSSSRTDFTPTVTITDGQVVTSTDPVTGDPATTVAVPSNPAANTRIDFTINHTPNGGDRGYVLLNQQILNADGYSRTLNAVHIVMEGANAFGDIVIGQVKCGHP